MSMRKLTKLAGTGLSGLLIACFIVMSLGLIFALAPANPVSADNGEEECLIDDEPDPAKLVASNMLVSPEHVHPNQQIEISINIGNTGGTAGTHEVNLYINGHFENNQTVAVPAGSTQLVVFTTTRAQPGTYYVSVDGHEGQFSVMGDAPTHWDRSLGTGGIIAIIVVVIALVLGLVFIIRRQ